VAQPGRRVDDAVGDKKARRSTKKAQDVGFLVHLQRIHDQ
jgi:hypothetical protein